MHIYLYPLRQKILPTRPPVVHIEILQRATTGQGGGFLPQGGGFLPQAAQQAIFLPR